MIWGSRELRRHTGVSEGSAQLVGLLGYCSVSCDGGLAFASSHTSEVRSCKGGRPSRYLELRSGSPLSSIGQPPGSLSAAFFHRRWLAWAALTTVGGAAEQGDADNFLESQLKPGNLEAAAAAASYPMEIRMQPGYDHSYFFIATFMEDHVRFHAKALLA